MSNQRTDAQILAAVLGSQTERQGIFGWIYAHSGWREWVMQHVESHDGNAYAGEDVFQETLILFDRNLREGRFRHESALKTYFLGIAKQFWLNRQRSVVSKTHDAPDETKLPFEDSPEKKILEKERKHAIEAILAELGERCRQVLALYKLSLSNEEIARELGLSSPGLAKKYTYRCREKFKAFVLERPQLLDLLNIKLNNG